MTEKVSVGLKAKTNGKGKQGRVYCFICNNMTVGEVFDTGVFAGPRSRNPQAQAAISEGAWPRRQTALTLTSRSYMTHPPPCPSRSLPSPMLPQWNCDAVLHF